MIMTNKEIKIRIAGSGGQGIVSAGMILANSYFLNNFQVFQTQTYGAAVRGETAACDVIVSSSEIYEINMNQIDYLLIMNKSSFEAYKSNLIEKGTIILFDSLLKELSLLLKNNSFQIFTLNDEKILKEITSPLPLSISLLGGFIKQTDQISLETIEKVIKNNLSEKYLEINIKALKLGYESIKKV